MLGELLPAVAAAPVDAGPALVGLVLLLLLLLLLLLGGTTWQTTLCSRRWPELMLIVSRTTTTLATVSSSAVPTPLPDQASQPGTAVASQPASQWPDSAVARAPTATCRAVRRLAATVPPRGSPQEQVDSRAWCAEPPSTRQ